MFYFIYSTTQTSLFKDYCHANWILQYVIFTKLDHIFCDVTLIQHDFKIHI